MSASAIVMLIISVVVVWGGLVGALLLLRRFPEVPDDEPDGSAGPSA